VNKIISILLILTFFLQSTSQLWILASFKLNQEYIAVHLCVNRFDAKLVCRGACYLEKQLNKDRQQQEKLPDLKTKEMMLFCQTSSFTVAHFYDQPSNIKHNSINTSLITSGYIHFVFRPPASLFNDVFFNC